MSGEALGEGPLTGLRVVELCDEKGAWAGKLLADAGAEVVKVEPPEGDATRQYEPFLEDEPGRERSLWWWLYNTSKRGVTLDLEQAEGREVFKRLVARADVVVESQRPGRLAEWGIDYGDLREGNAGNPGLIWASITPFGREGPRHDEEATDLTILAGGGMVWMNGYDDHALPPVRGGGNQGYHTGCHYAFMAVLVALAHRDFVGGDFVGGDLEGGDAGGPGQLIDVNMHAAANVTTEAGSYDWLVKQREVQRQTGRHASYRPTMLTQVRCADGVWMNTGIAPRRPHEFQVMYDWIAELGKLEAFPEAAILLAAAAGGEVILGRLEEDEEMQAKFASAREAVMFIAGQLPAREFFNEGQRRGFQMGIINSPEEVLEDPHFQARGFPVEVEHPELGRSFRYPGAPWTFGKAPWRIGRRAPLLGEDNAEVYGELGLGAEELSGLRARGVI